MKVAIVCDQLVERTPAHALVELVCNLFPEATIYTLAHKKGKVLGPVEMHSIRSTFLSNEVESLEQLKAKSFHLPRAIKSLPVPCSFDAVICLSSGIAHKFVTCAKSKKIEILIENVFKETSGSFLEKFFRSSTIRFSEKGLSDDLIFSSHPEGIKEFELCPFVNTNDWFAKEDREPPRCVIVDPDGLDLKTLRDLKRVTQEKNLDFVLKHLPSGFDSSEFSHLEHPCSGEMLPMFHQALCFVHAQRNRFPFGAIEANLSGVPVISLFSELNSRVLLDGATRFTHDFSDFDVALEDVRKIRITKELDQLIRRKFSEKVFKARFLRFLKEREIHFSID